MNIQLYLQHPILSFNKVGKYIKNCTEIGDEEKKDGSDKDFDLTDGVCHCGHLRQ
jgi:hypothetical protein